jgi:hypothetical protein
MACSTSSGGAARAPSAEPEPALTEPNSEPPEAAAPEPREPASSIAPADTPAPAEAADAPAGREIRYLVTAQGLEIEVSGVRFVATATPIKLAGGWGVKVMASATSRDGKTHQLLNPKRGPLAFAGAVERGGQSTRFGDKREGDESLALERKLELSRVWPGDTGEKPLKNGDALTLEVGLWGLSDGGEDRRPVKQFFVVRMTAGQGKPQPVVQPPEKFQ